MKHRISNIAKKTQVKVYICMITAFAVTIAFASSITTKADKNKYEEFGNTQVEASSTNDYEGVYEHRRAEVYQEGNYTIPFFSYNNRFDKAFYLRNIKFNDSGNGGEIIVKPFDLVYEEDFASCEKYGLVSQENGGSDFLDGYECVDTGKTEETLKITDKTQFLIVNWSQDKSLEEISLNHDSKGLLAINDFKRFKDNYLDSEGNLMTNYPLFAFMDEDNNVQTIVELCIP